MFFYNLQQLFWRYSGYELRPTFWQLPIAFSKLVGPELPLFECSVHAHSLSHSSSVLCLKSLATWFGPQTVNHLADAVAAVALAKLLYNKF